jgi:hypothetical protein
VDTNQPERLKLSVTRALAEEVTENLAGVYACAEGTRILLYAYFFKEPTEEDREHIEMAATYAIADHPEPFSMRRTWILFPMHRAKGSRGFSCGLKPSLPRTLASFRSLG